MCSPHILRGTFGSLKGSLENVTDTCDASAIALHWL